MLNRAVLNRFLCSFPPIKDRTGKPRLQSTEHRGPVTDHAGVAQSGSCECGWICEPWTVTAVHYWAVFVRDVMMKVVNVNVWIIYQCILNTHSLYGMFLVKIGLMGVGRRLMCAELKW